MASEPLLVLTCLPQDYDAVTHTCAAPFYSAPEGALPTMSIADAQEIGLSIAGLLAVAWVFRVIRKSLDQIGG